MPKYFQFGNDIDADKLKRLAEKAGLKGNAYPSVREALKEARKNAGKEDLVLAGGSTFVVAEVV